MTYSPFQIDGLAMLIFGFLSPDQIYLWIKHALKQNQTTIARKIIRLSQLLTLEMYDICAKSDNVVFLFSCHLRPTCGAWISVNSDVQKKLMLNPQFNHYCEFYSILCTSPSKVISHAFAKQNINALTHGLCALEHMDDAIKIFTTGMMRHSSWWTPDMIEFLVEFAPPMVDALRFFFEKKPLKVYDRKCMDLLYQHHILDQSKRVEYYMRVKDQKTIIELFEPDFPVHPQHSAILLKYLCRHHKFKADVVLKLLKPLWRARCRFRTQRYNRDIFEAIDPNNSNFKSMFKTPIRFFKQAIRRKCKGALHWGTKHLVVSTKSAKKIFRLVLADMPTATKILAACIVAWPNAARKCKQRLNQHMFAQFSCEIGDALADAGLVDWDFPSSFTTSQWRELARAPHKFFRIVWRDTTVFEKNFKLVFTESFQLCNENSEFLWQKKPNIIAQRSLVRASYELFKKERFLMLRSILRHMGPKRINRCYEVAASDGNDAHFAFLQQNWPNNEIQVSWIKTSIALNLQFVAYFYNARPCLRNFFCCFFLGQTKTKVKQFLKLVDYNYENDILWDSIFNRAQKT